MQIKSLIQTFEKFRWQSLLLAATMLLFSVIEIRHPYFFLQDDNRTLYLPFYVHNLRALLGGEFPFYNFHQYLGTPVTIQYAALYPINYLALCLSNLLLGNYFGAMDIIAIVHMLAAALGFFALMRNFKLEEVSCFFGALAWTFCGFVITVGNSWIQTVGFAAYLPWILLFSIKQIQRFEIRWFSALIVLKVCEMLLGYPQLFIYTATFELLTVVMLYAANLKIATASTESVSLEISAAKPPSFVKLLSAFIANYACVFIISLPLIVLTLHQASQSAGRSRLLSWDEYAAFSYKLIYWINGLIAPFKQVDVTTQFELHFISHIGYLTLVCALVAIIPVRWINPNIQNNATNSDDSRERIVFGLIALLSLLWSGDILVTRILYYVPFFNRLRFPFKVGFFTSFYLIMLATYGFNICYASLRNLKAVSQTIIVIVSAVVLILHMTNFLVLYAALPQQMFSRHLDPVPFAEPLSDKLTNGRIISAGLDDVWDGEKIIPGYSVPMLGFDYATLWGLFHFGGYDPMVSEKAQNAALGIKNNPVFNLPAGIPFQIPTETLEYFRKWGVKWYVVNNAIPLSANAAFKLIYRDSYRFVLEDVVAKPMVYWQENRITGNSLKYRFNTNSIDVDCKSERGGTIILNVLYHPFFSARLDGKVVPITETADNQVSVIVPPGQQRITLLYTDKRFIYASIVSVVFILFLVPCLLVARTKAAFMKYMS